MFYDIMQITIISIAALIAIIYLSICQNNMRNYIIRYLKQDSHMTFLQNQ